jgi:PelA/Pel-15E family pectate lyase
MPSQSAAESTGVLLFLMDLPHPTVAEIRAIDNGSAWLAKVAIADSAWRSTPDGRYLVPSPGAPLLWARFYQIGTDLPLFGDRDKSIHDKVTEISSERRNGYSWYNATPKRAVARYAEWRKIHRPGVVSH